MPHQRHGVPAGQVRRRKDAVRQHVEDVYKRQAFGYWEQQGLFRPNYEQVQQMWQQDADFMAEVEDAAGEGAMLFQLPYMKNFENGSLNNMWDYTCLLYTSRCV